jgi:hypothetical protein
VLDEARVAAHLAQLQQCVEHDDVAAREPLLRHLAAHLFVHRQPHRLVKIALLPGELERPQYLGLGRQFGGDQGLGPPQQERLHPAREHGTALAIRLLLDRSTEDSGKASGITEQPRHRTHLAKSSFLYAAMLFCAMIAEVLGGVVTDHLLRRTGNLQIARSRMIAASWILVVAQGCPGKILRPHNGATRPADFVLAGLVRSTPSRA